jgi:hypothetical protein
VVLSFGLLRPYPLFPLSLAGKGEIFTSGGHPCDKLRAGPKPLAGGVLHLFMQKKGKVFKRGAKPLSFFYSLFF